MFSLRKQPKSEIVREMSDDLKRKISEIHLKIRSGELTPAEIAEAYAELKRIKDTLGTKVLRAAKDAANDHAP